MDRCLLLLPIFPDPGRTGLPFQARDISAQARNANTSNQSTAKKPRTGDSPFSFTGIFPQQSPDTNILDFPLPDTPQLRRLYSASSYGANPQRLPSLSGNFASAEPSPALSGDLEILDACSTVSRTSSRVYVSAPVWPLTDLQEARLMRYFVEKLAESFDLCDASRHFAQTVPQRAAICPTLLNAILAASARHLSRVSNFDPLISDQYHQKCLTHLIPILGDKAAVMNENLLAATVILRFLEEVEIPISGVDFQSHLLGTHVFITAQEASTTTGGLRQAAYWVALRQEIYIAFVNQRTIAPAFEGNPLDRSLDAADDCTWANRIIVHLADVMRYCFGDQAYDRGVATYNALLEYCQQWMLFKPMAFTPLYYKEAGSTSGDGDGVFPEIWLMGTHVVTALQHYHLALILLAAHDPKIPRLGPGQRTALQAMDVSFIFLLLLLSTPPFFGTEKTFHAHVLPRVNIPSKPTKKPN